MAPAGAAEWPDGARYTLAPAWPIKPIRSSDIGAAARIV
jgi:hypothetical protein